MAYWRGNLAVVLLALVFWGLAVFLAATLAEVVVLHGIALAVSCEEKLVSLQHNLLPGHGAGLKQIDNLLVLFEGPSFQLQIDQNACSVAAALNPSLRENLVRQRQHSVLPHHQNEGLQVVQPLFDKQETVLAQAQRGEPLLKVSRNTLICEGDTCHLSASQLHLLSPYDWAFFPFCGLGLLPTAKLLLWHLLANVLGLISNMCEAALAAVDS